MQQKSILVTGCSSGIGHHVATTLAAAGWRVFATVRRQEDAIVLPNCEVLFLDATDSDSIQGCANEISHRTGHKLDALFCNIGVGVPGAVEDLSRAAMRYQFEVNVFGTIELINALLPIMRQQQQGRIIINSSILGFAAMPYRGAYNASKFALEGFADTLRQELYGSGIHVILVEPGPIKSRFRANAQAQFDRWIAADISMHRLAYVAMSARLNRPGKGSPFTEEPEAVLRAIHKALEDSPPAIRYRVTKPTIWFWYLKRLLPARWFDWFCRMGSGDEPGYVYGRKHLK